MKLSEASNQGSNS